MIKEKRKFEIKGKKVFFDFWKSFSTKAQARRACKELVATGKWYGRTYPAPAGNENKGLVYRRKK